MYHIVASLSRLPHPISYASLRARTRKIDHDMSAAGIASSEGPMQSGMNHPSDGNRFHWFRPASISVLLWGNGRPNCPCGERAARSAYDSCRFIGPSLCNRLFAEPTECTGAWYRSIGNYNVVVVVQHAFHLRHACAWITVSDRASRGDSEGRKDKDGHFGPMIYPVIELGSGINRPLCSYALSYRGVSGAFPHDSPSRLLLLANEEREERAPDGRRGEGGGGSIMD